MRKTTGNICVSVEDNELMFTIIGSLRPPNHVLEKIYEEARQIKPSHEEVKEFVSEDSSRSSTGGYVRIGKWEHRRPEMSSNSNESAYTGSVEETEYRFSYNPIGDSIDTTIKGWFDGVEKYYTTKDDKPDGWNSWPRP